LYYAELGGKDKKGRPCKTWLGRIKESMNRWKLEPGDVHNWKEWRCKIKLFGPNRGKQLTKGNVDISHENY
jgi:hypothetical protein